MSVSSASLRQAAFVYANNVALAEAARRNISVPDNRLSASNPQHAELIKIWVQAKNDYIANGGPPSNAAAKAVVVGATVPETISAHPPAMVGAPLTGVGSLAPPSGSNSPLSGGAGAGSSGLQSVPAAQTPVADNLSSDNAPGEPLTECQRLKAELSALVERVKAGACQGDDTLANDIAARLGDFERLKNTDGTDLFSQLPIGYRIAAQAVAAQSSEQGSGPETYSMNHAGTAGKAMNKYAELVMQGTDPQIIRDNVVSILRQGFTENSANLVYDRIKEIATSEKIINQMKNVSSSVDAGNLLGFRKQCKEFVDSIAKQAGGKVLGYRDVGVEKYMSGDNPAVGKGLYQYDKNGNWMHAGIVTGISRDPNTNEITGVTVSESNYQSANFNYLYEGRSIPGQVPWERRVTSRFIGKNEFYKYRMADIDGSSKFPVNDFWIKENVSTSIGKNNFDAQFKVTNPGPCPAPLNSLALQVVDKNGKAVLDFVQEQSALAPGATAHMPPGATVGTISITGDYTVIAKANFNGVWRELGRRQLRVN